LKSGKIKKKTVISFTLVLKLLFYFICIEKGEQVQEQERRNKERSTSTTVIASGSRNIGKKI
jgi:hypothetical protein